MRWVVLLFAAVLANNASGQLVWPLNSAVTDLSVGPSDAIYCKLFTPSGAIVFDGFGTCRVNIDRVTTDHDGLWIMRIIQQNNVRAFEEQLLVQVATANTKATVTTQVETNKPLVDLSCSVGTTDPVTACVFRDPSGQVLQSRQGLSEDRFSFIESSQTGFCGLRINGPLTSDLGLWRCDVQTATETYYGHLTVLCPWAMQDPEVAASVVSEPTLTAQMSTLHVREGEGVTMSCSIQSEIRYCYFRARNGSIFNVRPGVSTTSMEYVGAGLDAGECGIHFRNILSSDRGDWSCHVGLPDSAEEQRVTIGLHVEEELKAEQYLEGSVLLVQGDVFGYPRLDYCRFIRIDGIGFLAGNIPSDNITAVDDSNLNAGLCRIRIYSPSILDNHPWTVVAKVAGHDQELSASTDQTLSIPFPNDGRPPRRWWFFVIPMMIMLLPYLGVYLICHRKWAAEQVTRMRNSFRRGRPQMDGHGPHMGPQDEKPPLPA